jgi:hypothetical protein
MLTVTMQAADDWIFTSDAFLLTEAHCHSHAPGADAAGKSRVSGGPTVTATISPKLHLECRSQLYS